MVILVNAKYAELERRSAHQLRLKAVEILRSSTQLVKSHGDDHGQNINGMGMNTVLWQTV